MSHNRVTEAILFGILFTQLQSCVTAGVNYKCGLGAEWCVCVCVCEVGLWCVDCVRAAYLSFALFSLARTPSCGTLLRPAIPGESWPPVHQPATLLTR